MEDNSIQIKKDLETFVYQLRLPATVHVVEMHDKDISAYTYERTLVMEQRNKMLQQMKLTGRRMSQPQLIVDAAHSAAVNTSTSTTPSIVDPVKVNLNSDSTVLGGVMINSSRTSAADTASGNGIHPSASSGSITDKNMYTFSASAGQKLRQDFHAGGRPDRGNVRRMHTAVRLNETIKERSLEAQLIILNLPCPPKNESGEENYMEYLEVLTEGFERVLMVRGGGAEVITIYS